MRSRSAELRCAAGRLTLSLAVALTLVGSPAAAGSFTVTDADFPGDVYDFHYYADGNELVVNGSSSTIADASLTLTNTCFSERSQDADGSTNGLVRYWHANGSSAASCTAGDLTLGWDFSAVTRSIQKVEIKTRHLLFQFSPYTANAAGDEIYGQLATPATFGAGGFADFYRFTGDNTTATLGEVGTLDVTSQLPAPWLASPGLLELKLGYTQTPTPTIPGRHLQVFRNNEPAGDDGFLLRVTLEPASGDADGDGVDDGLDVCADTAIPEGVPTRRLGWWRYALMDGDTVFETRRLGRRRPPAFTVEDTAGCSCEQIIAALGLGRGHRRWGCSLGAMKAWVALVNP